jgi:glycosyl transferase family 25
MKAYVINLDRDPERMAHIERQGKQFGIDWHRVPATDKLDEGIAARAARARPGLLGFTMSAGAIAVFESHRKTWKLIVESGDSHGAVFEDDVVCSKELPDFLSTAEWIPPDCDVMKLETFLERTTIRTKPARLFSGRRIVRLYGRHLGACAYIVSRGAAERLLAQSENFTDPVDEFLFNAQSLHFPRLTLYQVDPAPCIQGGLLGLEGKADYMKSSNDQNLKLRKKPYRNLVHYLTRKVVRLWGKLLELFGYRERRRIEFRPD